MEEKFKLRGRLKQSMRWPFILSILLILVNVPVYALNIHAGILLSLITAAYIILSLALFTYNRPVIMNELLAFASQYEQIEKQMLDNLTMPCALIDEEGNMIWSNKKFLELTKVDSGYKKNISLLFPEINKELLSGKNESQEKQIHYGDRIFNATFRRISLGNLAESTNMIEGLDDKTSVVAVYLLDKTELAEYIQEIEDNKLVVALAYLDNYDEALESVEEVRRSLLIALIDRKITKYFSNYDGMVRKLEKDKYFLIMRQSSLKKLKEQKFPILDEVKTVNIGNEMSVTLSIGIGINASTYIQDYEYSRIAIEMALGRGGDQVVIKDGDTITYFGGKSQQMEKTTRVKARVKAQALKEFISTRDRVVVMGHKITDVDAFGAAVGIYRAAKTLGKPAHIVVNDPTTSIRPLMAGFVESSDYADDMFLSSQEAKELVDNRCVVVVVDTNKPSYTECEDLLYKTKTIVVLDHHRRGSEVIQNAVLSYVEPYASSTCEMVAEILQYFSDGIRIRNIEADSIYAGIMIDTNNFTTRAGVRTFEAAAFLRRCGADVTRVRKMPRDDMDSYRARAETICNAIVYKTSFVIGVCPSEGLKSPTVVGAQAANELLNIDGVKASFVLTKYKGIIYISARAIDEVNVQVMMERLGGGGHMNVSGAQISGRSVEDVVQMIKDIIDDLNQEEV